MKILKSLCHIEVDRMLAAALGDALTVIRVGDHTGWITDEQINIKSLTRDVDAIKETEYDAVIYDDSRTWDELKKKLKIRARNEIFYVHGTYHTWRDFQVFANENLQNCNFIFTDESRLLYWWDWYRNEMKSKLILPIHLQDHYFAELPHDKNGKVFTIGNEVLSTSSLYSDQSPAIVDELFNLGHCCYHIYGYNGLTKPEKYGLDPDKFKLHLKGNAFPIREKLNQYSASLHPSYVDTLGFALLECMAAGIPVICTPKVDFAQYDFAEHDKPFIITKDPVEFYLYAEHYMKSEAESYNIGMNARKFLREHYPFENYKTKLNNWLEEII